MPQHELKTCERCHTTFECKAGDINHCQCRGIYLSNEEMAFIESRYDDCLCFNCLLQLKNRNTLFNEKYLFNPK